MINEYDRPSLKKSLYSMMLPDGRLVFAFTPHEITVLPKPSLLQRELLYLLTGELTVEEIVIRLNEKGINCNSVEILTELSHLENNFLLEKGTDEFEITDLDISRYSRQLLFFAAKNVDGLTYATNIQKRLQQSHVVLFGLGGFGTHLFYELVALGIGKLTVVDYDTVDLSNLNRQCLYKESDIGKKKIRVAEEVGRAINNSIDFHFLEHKLLSPDDMIMAMNGADLTILAADSPREKIFHWMNIACYESVVPALFSLGVTQSFVRIGPMVVPGKTPCFECAMPSVESSFDDSLIKFINQRYRHGVIVPFVMCAASMLVFEAVKHLTGFSQCQIYGRIIHLNLMNYHLRVENIQSRTECRFCGNNCNRGG